jgi:predicted ATPase
MLMRRWGRARQGEGQLVTIVGEPGLGKSRLIVEFHARLRDTPHTWTEWSCSQLLQNTALHPVTEWGRQRFGSTEVPGAAAHVRQSLKPDGSWMIVEPMAGDRLEDNLNPIGRLYYGASTMVCVPTSLAQEVGAALGAQAGEAKLREVIGVGGFSNVRRATETPFNMILEARP